MAVLRFNIILLFLAVKKVLNSFIFPWQLDTVGGYVNFVVDKAMLATSNMAARVVSNV